MAKVNFLNQFVFQKAAFLNFMVMHIRKPENLEEWILREVMSLIF